MAKASGKTPGGKPRRKSAGKTSPGRTSAAGRAAGDPATAAIAAAMRLAADKGWRGLTLAEIADAAGLSLAELHALYPSRQAILDGLRHAVDRAVLAGGPVTEGPARVRLFEILMRRFDALEPWRPGIVAVVEGNSRDPAAILCGSVGLVCSMASTLEAAGIDSSGIRGLVRAKALATAWLPALRVWLSDESDDHAATMASLDRGLRRLDTVARWCRAPFVARAKPEEA